MSYIAGYKDLISQFQIMFREHWAYDWSGSDRGKVGCAGAFVYAYREFGKSLYNGSNRICRTEIVELLPISQAKPGMAAFKIRKPGDPKYNLKDDYKQGGKYYNGDLNDYYHIGLVDEDPNYVLNAQGESTGFVRSPIKQNWTFCGYLKSINYGGNQPMEDKKRAVVVLPKGATGKTVNLRIGANKSSRILEQVPMGAAIEVLFDYGEWCKIRWGDKEGYMMSNYIEYLGQNDTDESDSVVVNRAEMEAIYDKIGDMLGLRG